MIICGGIISLKEQWVRALNLLNKFGFSIILTELPGVGQNNIPYDSSCCTFFTEILNELDIQSDANCHILGLSFSGYIALRNSNTDHRIKAITMVGTPINSIYHDKIYFDNLPDITKQTIIYNINKQLDKKRINSNEELFYFFDENFPLPVNKNSNIKIFYLQSKYDEVIPQNEISYLRQNYYHFKQLTLPDTHGSPHYHKTVVLFIIWTVLNSMNKKPVTRTFIKLLINVSKVIKF